VRHAGPEHAVELDRLLDALQALGAAILDHEQAVPEEGGLVDAPDARMVGPKGDYPLRAAYRLCAER